MTGGLRDALLGTDSAVGTIGLLAPERLLLLLPVAALVLAYVLVQRRRPRTAVRFATLDLLASVAPRGGAWRRHVPAGLLLLSLVALTTAFARPEADREVPRERATVIVALDTSLSMMARDVAPDRITAAQQAAVRFLEGLPARFRVGLVSFSGTAAVLVPPTTDRAAVVRAVDALSLGEGTAIGDAVAASVSALAASPDDPSLPPPPARVVLLSDGANTQGRSIAQALSDLGDAVPPVSTIAYGTEEGEVVVQGQRIPVPVDAQSLARLADSTGGQAYAAQDEAELAAVYDDIGTQVGTTTEREEVTDLVTGLGLLLAAGAAVTALVWAPRLA